MFYDYQSRIEREKPALDLQKYAGHTRSLIFDALWLPSEESISPDCIHLTSLYLNLVISIPDCHSTLYSSRLVELIKRNSNIQTLQVCRAESAIMDHLLSEAKILKYLPSLKNLILMNGYVCKSSSFKEIMDHGSQLRTLDYDMRWESPGDAEMEDSKGGDCPMWTRLSSLSIKDSIGSRAVEVVRQCPNIQHFNVVLLNDEDRHSVLRQMVQHRLSGYPSRLESLDLFGVRGRESIAALVNLLQVCAESTRLKSFRLDCSDASPEVIEALLTSHAESLEEVTLSLCDHAPDSLQLNEFLTKCPKLRHLEVWSRSTRMKLEDIVQSPWVCKDLQVLDARLSRSSSVVLLGTSSHMPNRQNALPTIPENETDDEVQLQRRLWEQVGKLTKLQRLNIIMRKTARTEGATLWATQDGIEQLSQLKRLAELTVSNERYPLRKHDKEQLLDRTPRLRIRHPN
ncbi:hypothetical protein B0O80DRAFT_496491 [Mortierella sp. GBAus27b]|nr:hypothetical protein B0O80DRAFT_496491 [Mortierella sp. GBAus27b]